jgi:GDP-L-fucose synthase
VGTTTGFGSEIISDECKPDGMPKKKMNVSRLAALGCQARISLAQGLASTVAYFANQGSWRT